MATNSSSHSPRTVEEIFKDFSARHAAVLRALTTDVEDFYSQCDPERDNLCLYGHPNESWEVAVPAEEVPPELPEPVLGINFARDGMERRDWLSLVAMHTDSWLLSVAFYFGARLNRNERSRVFTLINDLPTVFEAVTGRKPLKDKPSVDSGKKSKNNAKREKQMKANQRLQEESDDEDEGTNNKMFKSQLTSVFFMFLFALSPIYGYFELLELVSTWPATYCYAYGCSRRPIPNNFTIHGLWPDNKSVILNNCNFAKKEDRYTKITDPKKKSELDKRWPQLRYEKLYGIEKQDLWEKEFLKHGSCSINRYKQEAYFDLAMKIKDRFDLLGTLRNQGIIPGSTYELDDIERAVKTVSIEVPSLKCIQKPLGNVELNEIGICLDPEAKYTVPCPRIGSCHKMGHKIKFR